MKYLLGTCLFMLFVFAIPVSAQNKNDRYMKIEKSYFISEVSVSNTPLQLQGGAMLEYYGFDVYTMAVYCLEENFDRETFLNDEAKAFEIVYHRTIKRKDIIKSTEKTIKKNPNIRIEKLRERLDKFYQWYETVEDGDRFRVTYSPDTGTSLYFNNELKGTVEGADFASAFFGIWFSEHCIDSDFRDELFEKRN